VISWGTILYGAALTALISAAVLLIRPSTRRLDYFIPGIVAAFVAPIAWNAILRATHANQFFTDAPVAAIPASWQDTGSGVFTFTIATLVLTALHRRAPAGRIVIAAGTVALIAFLVDVYLY